MDVPDGPAEGKVPFVRHRAMVDVATGDLTKLPDDLDADLLTDEAPVNVKRTVGHRPAKRKQHAYCLLRG
jgi:hypothetical protein